MPTEKVSTYLGCKKTPSSFFNISNYQGAEWHEITPADINTAREFGSELLNRIYHSSFLSANARALVLSTFAHTNYPFKSKEMYANSPRKESLKVSLEIFKAFDDEDSPELFPVFEQLIHVIKTQISSLIMNEDCTVAINFS